MKPKLITSLVKAVRSKELSSEVMVRVAEGIPVNRRQGRIRNLSKNNGQNP